jgi:hypothetical protein
MQRIPTDERTIRQLAAVMAPSDRIFLHLGDYRPIAYAEYYLGSGFDARLTNLATLDPNQPPLPELGNREHHWQTMAAAIATALEQGGRVFLDESLLPPPSASNVPREFVRAMCQHHQAVAVQWQTGWLWALLPRP